MSAEPIIASESSAIEPLLTVDDLALLLQRSARTIRYWRSRGLLPEPDLVLERTVRWRRATVAAWLDSRPNLPA